MEGNCKWIQFVTQILLCALCHVEIEFLYTVEEIDKRHASNFWWDYCKNCNDSKIILTTPLYQLPELTGWLIFFRITI